MPLWNVGRNGNIGTLLDFPAESLGPEVLMLTVHHLNNSRSQRVLWLLEELGCPTKSSITSAIRTTQLAPPELKQVHPLGKSPVITDDGATIAETGAIIEYLVDKAGGRFARRRARRSGCAGPIGCIMPKARRCRLCC